VAILSARRRSLRERPADPAAHALRDRGRLGAPRARDTRARDAARAPLWRLEAGLLMVIGFVAMAAVSGRARRSASLGDRRLHVHERREAARARHGPQSPSPGCDPSPWRPVGARCALDHRMVRVPRPTAPRTRLRFAARASARLSSPRPGRGVPRAVLAVPHADGLPRDPAARDGPERRRHRQGPRQPRRPVDAAGQPTAWSDPHLRLETWLGRRMPPFTAPRRSDAPLRSTWRGWAVTRRRARGRRGGRARAVLFEDNCAMCHGADGEWPIGPRVTGKAAQDLYEMLAACRRSTRRCPVRGSDEDRAPGGTPRGAGKE